MVLCLQLVVRERHSYIWLICRVLVFYIQVVLLRGVRGMIGLLAWNQEFLTLLLARVQDTDHLLKSRQLVRLYTALQNVSDA